MFGVLALNAAHSRFRTVRQRQYLARRRIARIGVLLLSAVLAIAAVGQANATAAHPSVVSPHAMTGGTGTGGQFVPLQTRIADTRGGTGGYSTPLPAGSWRSYQVTGTGTIPTSGVASVVVTVTVLASGAAGNLALAPNTSLPSTATTFLLFSAADTVSNTGVVDVGADGKIAIKSSTSIDVLIDVQGYLTVGDGSPAPGGYVSANNTRIVDTRNGTGLPQQQLTVGSTATVSATGGSTGIPTTATALYVNITVLTTSTVAGAYITPYATGTTKPATSMNFEKAATAGAVTATALGTTVDVNSSGQFNIYLGPGGGSVDILVDVQGYFDGEPSTSGFTPVTSRIYNSQTSPGVALAANSVTTITLGGVGGIPTASASLAGVALNVQTTSGTQAGSLRLWPADQNEPSTSNLNYYANGFDSSLTLVQPSQADGTIKVRNSSTGTVNLVLDAEGYFTNPSVLPPAVGINPTGSGSRTAAAMISHRITDRIGAQINPTNGNLLITQSLLSLAGIGQSASVMMRYNALNDARPTLSTGMFETQLYADGAGKVTYTGPDGAGYVFVPTGSSYTGYDAAGMTDGNKTLYSYVVPNGINAMLVRVGPAGAGAEYDLTFHPSQVMNVYGDTGSNILLNSSQDVTGANHVSYTYAKGALTTITDTQGRTISFTYNDASNPTQPSTITDNSLGRTINLTYAGPSSALSKIVDATGSQTLFAYNAAGKISTITDGRGTATTFTYDSSNRVLTLVAAASITAPTQATTASTWTMAYPSSTQSTMSDPDSNTATYNITNGQVTSIKDPRTFTSSSTYNSHNDLTKSTTSYSDVTTTSVATSTYNIMSVTSPSGTQGGSGNTGRVTSYQYPTSPSGPGGSYGTLDYRPTKATDPQGNANTMSYNTFGQITSSSTDVAQGGTSHRTYQNDNLNTASCGGHTGQLCSTTDGKGNVTSYAYNAAGNLTTMTPPAPLGAHTFTYDAAGRKVTENDGRGNTATTCYDNDDRITQVSYTGNCSTTSGVTYRFDAVGDLISRQTVATGTTVSWTYDGQNRPTMQSDSAGSTSATYDPAGNVLTFVNGGTTSYTYDADNNVVSLAQPGGSCPSGASTAIPNTTGCTVFLYDHNDRRTDTQYPNGVVNHYTFDPSNRIIGLLSTTSVTSSKPTQVTMVNQQYSYTKGTTTETGVIQSHKDILAGTNTNYTYDHLNRLTGDTVLNSGGDAVSTDSYAYDLNGNITQQVTAGTTTNYGYNAADEMCWSAMTTGTGCTTPTGGTTYTYDGNGNTQTGDATTGTNTYTPFNQLGSSTTGGNQSYSYAGTNGTQRVSAGGITFTTGLLGHVDSQSGGTAGAQYIRDPSGTLIALQVSGSTYYYTLDNETSILQLTDTNQNIAASYTYNPYGKTLTATGTQATVNPYRYTSGYTDTTGLIKFGARYYNPTLTRFTQIDPARSGTNYYQYAADSPISARDPSGEEVIVASGPPMDGAQWIYHTQFTGVHALTTCIDFGNELIDNGLAGTIWCAISGDDLTLVQQFALASVYE